MLQVLENSPTRLVIKLTQRLNVSTATFDKSTGRARFERVAFFWKRKPVDVALDEIESITAAPVGARGVDTSVPLVKLKAGGTLSLPDAGSEAETVEAVRQMRTFVGMTPEGGLELVADQPAVTSAADQPAVTSAADHPAVTRAADQPVGMPVDNQPVVTPAADQPVVTPAGDEPAAAPSPVRRWSIRVAAIAAAAAVLIIGGARVINLFSLPACDAELTRKTISEVFAEKKIQLDTLADVRSLGSVSSENTCKARADVPGGFLNLDYRIAWEGWKAGVTLTRVEAMATIEPARLGEIRRAVSDFLALAREAHTTGRPPRQSDPSVKALLDKVFDTSDFDGATLAASDIGRAMEWLNTGDRVGVVYMLAGTGVSEISKLPTDPRSQQRTHLNIAEFAPEFARYLDFQVKLGGAMADAALRRAAEAAPDELDRPEVKKELGELRTMLTETISGDLTSLAYEGLSDEWRRDRLAVLMELAPKAARILSPEQARTVQQHALNVVPYVRNSFVQDTLRAFSEQIAAK